MTRRMPAIRRLADELRAAPTGRRQVVSDSIAYLVSHRARLAVWQDVEDLALDAYGERPTDLAQPLAHHLLEVRQVIARELYTRQIFVGASVLDDLLFFSVRDASVVDPLLDTLEFLRDRGVNRPGMVLMPLHGFGILGAGWLHARSQRRIEVQRPEWRLALTPQTNNIDKTATWLERSRLALGVRKPVSAESLHHYHRSRARWLERNPLLAVSAVNVSNTVFENQRLLMSRVRAATGLLALVAAHQAHTDDDPVRLFSSSRTNNFETLDIHHYIVLSDNPGLRGHLESKIVPLNLDREDVVELTDLNVQLDPRVRRQRPAAIARMEPAVTSVYEGWLAHAYGRDDGGSRGRVYRKAFDSLGYFRRSWRGGGGRWSTSVSLAIAFEMLLSDAYSGGVTDRIIRRVGLVLHGVRGRADHVAAVRELFSERGNIVHRGDVGGLDLLRAQRAYAEVFGRLGPRLRDVDPRWAEPIRRLTNDPGTPERDMCPDR